MDARSVNFDVPMENFDTLETVDVLVALGANVGNRRQTCDDAVERISSLPNTRLIAISAFVETPAVHWAGTAARSEISEPASISKPTSIQPLKLVISESISESSDSVPCTPESVKKNITTDGAKNSIISVDSINSTENSVTSTDVTNTSDSVDVDKIVGGTSYLNAVGRWRTTLSLETFFDLLQAIETDLGRVRSYRWAPRRIDLDLLFYGNTIWRTLRLWLPHPRLHLRRFVLDPAMEIAHDWRHAVLGETLTELKRRFDADVPLTIRNLPAELRMRFLEKMEPLCTSSMGGLSGPNGRTVLQCHLPVTTAVITTATTVGPVIDAACFPTVLFARNGGESRSREDEYQEDRNAEMERDAIDSGGIWSETALDALVAETFAAIQSRYADGRRNQTPCITFE